MPQILKEGAFRWFVSLSAAAGFIVALVLLVRELLVTEPISDTVWIILGALIVGFLMPWLIDLPFTHPRKKRYEQEETEEWGFHGNGGHGPWLNFYRGPIVVKSEIAKDYTFYSGWLVIQNGFIVVNPGASKPDLEKKTVSYDLDDPQNYAWNGSTPKVWFLWIALAGVPDWFRQEMEVETIRRDQEAGEFVRCPKKVFWQVAHKATLVHDALYQYLEDIPIEKKEVDRLFRHHLIEAGMPVLLAWIYFIAVLLFGGIFSNQKRIGEISEFECSSFDGIL